MYEPITLAKVLKDTTVKVPAGGWVIICSPDQPLATHLSERSKLIKGGNVSDKFSKIIIGRLQSVSPNVTLVTPEKAKELAAQQREQQDALSQHHEKALARQDKMAKDEAKRLEAEHKSRVAEVNKINDAIRNRDAAAAVPVTVIETAAAPESPAPAGETTEEAAK